VVFISLWEFLVSGQVRSMGKCRRLGKSRGCYAGQGYVLTLSSIVKRRRNGLLRLHRLGFSRISS
jgi:hypothetical protein